MKFRGHETFFIRKGWLSKGMKNITRDPTVFMGKNNNPMDVLGIGANMVKSLRYWMQAVGISEERIEENRKKQFFTTLGEIIYKNDPYIEELGTLWLLHYKLATNEKNATAWYFFYNEFKLKEFTRDDFIVHIKNYIQMKNETELSDRSLEDDYNCIISTYVPRIKTKPEKVHPESNIDCPLGELGLIEITNKKDKIFRKNNPQNKMIHPLILLAVIVSQADNKKEIRISSILNDSCNAGKIFNLDIISLIDLLYRIELLGYIKVVRTAGLDIIELQKDIGFEDCIIEYYNQIKF